jgi:glycosyltransferase involved in cell wall biosynthesis
MGLMRVVYLNPCGQLGGAEISLMDLIISMRAAEPVWEYYLVLGESGPLVDRAKAAGARVIVAPFPRALARLGDSGGGLAGAVLSCLTAAGATVRYAFQLRRKLAELQPDIVHANGFKMHVLGAWAHPKNAPVIWHIRDYVGSRPLMKWLLLLSSRRCAAAISNSASVAKDVRQVCGPGLDVLCVYNAIDLKRYSPLGGTIDLDTLAGMKRAPGATVRIGLVATLAHWKGHAVFLRALACLPQDLAYRAYVVGGAIYQTEKSQRTLGELRALASELGIGGKVGFTGYISDTAAAIRELDILVHASTQPEPFGRVIAEGMACGRSVICSAAGGAAELITPGENALAHRPGEISEMAGCIEKLVRDPELRTRLGRNGRATAEQRFQRSRLAAQVIPLYHKLAGHASVSGRS